MTVPRSNTYWTRLEPRPRTAEMTDALRAEVRDPLWLLSRQWQVQEFHGDDAGSPVRADVAVEHDHLLRYELGPPGRQGRGIDRPQQYTGGPLEALVEREPVLTNDGPPARLAAEAGLYFCRLLSAHGYESDDGPYAAPDFPEELVLADVEGGLDAGGRRFVRVMTDRVLDGGAVYAAIADAVTNLTAVAGGASPVVSEPDALPLPTDGDRTEAFDHAVVTYVGFYRSLFDEPDGPAETAWHPERMEYEFAVSTGDGDDETVFSAREYAGGHLDWHAFTVARDRTLGPKRTDGQSEVGGSDDSDGEAGDATASEPDASDEPGEATTAGADTRSEVDGRDAGDGATTATKIRTLPTRARFPGMPATRWWEFEDDAVTLGDVAASGASLARLLLLEFAVQYGSDWFLVPVEVPVGSLSRVTSLSITDSFGLRRSIGPTTARTEDWSAFTFADLPNADEPGLFLPPTLPTSLASEPVEHVVLARDEVANLAWGIERLVEGPVGDPVNRDEFEPPSLRIAAVSPARDDDAGSEFVDLENRGDDDLDVTGWTVRRVAGDEETTVFRFEDCVVPPERTLRLHSGPPTDPEDDERLHRYCDRSGPIWTDADSLVVSDDSGDDSWVVATQRLRQPSDAFADYRISTAVEDHWFPFKFDPASQTDHQLERARLLDAETLDVDPAHLPEPMGRVLNPNPALLEKDADTLRLYEEELTRGGTEVSRLYQFSSWSNGRQHLWAGRHVRAGRSEPSSDLRFDVLEDRSGSSVSIVDRGDASDDSEQGRDGDTDGDVDDELPRGETSLGLGENVVAAIAYLFGWLSGIIVLLAERKSEYARFHAAQSVVAFGTLFAARIILWVAQVLVFVFYYPAYPAGFYYPGGPSDPTTYLLLSWLVSQLSLLLWLVVAALWFYLVAWSALGRDPRIPQIAQPTRALARRVSPNR